MSTILNSEGRAPPHLYADDQAGEARRLLEPGVNFVRHHEDPDDDYVMDTVD
ncbi:hypothetical protein [Phytohabitans maris]|uniref:hypothetical protein n=1 Tax=Phytohabitans maris TaxID=3071409 RepID=UPI00280AA472|nr:hypothetical protein [Phytohabitans sp. ZYX-F-186]